MGEEEELAAFPSSLVRFSCKKLKIPDTAHRMKISFSWNPSSSYKWDFFFPGIQLCHYCHLSFFWALNYKPNLGTEDLHRHHFSPILKIFSWLADRGYHPKSWLYQHHQSLKIIAVIWLGNHNFTNLLQGNDQMLYKDICPSIIYHSKNVQIKEISKL